MTDGAAEVGGVLLRFEGGDGGIIGWELRGAPGEDEIDGLSTSIAAERPLDTSPRHPNTAFGVDHVVIFTPHLKRTIAALEGSGMELRRIREATEPGPDVRQAFFFPRGMIVEVVENPHAEEGPAQFWGVTLAVADIDRAAELLGDNLGEVRDAVQAGRRIATIRREAGLGVPVALITPHRSA